MPIFLESLPRPFFVLAPMDDVTDTVFRQVIAACAAPDVFFTEFVNVDGLQSPGRRNLLKKLRCSAAEQPLVVQLWGKDPENFYKTARQIADGTFAAELAEVFGREKEDAAASPQAAFAGVDLNMGCPDRTVVKNGCCSALINDRERAVAIIQAARAGLDGQLPLSVKTRLGFNTIDFSWPELLLRQNLTMLTMHGRTRRELSRVRAHWDAIGRVREMRDQLAPATLLVGNGDVDGRSHGLALARQYGLDGIMIGRAALRDPFVFALNSPWAAFTKQQRLEIFTKHVKLFAATWQLNERAIVTLNKFCKLYIQGFDGAKELREQLMAAASAQELISLLETFLAAN